MEHTIFHERQNMTSKNTFTTTEQVNIDKFYAEYGNDVKAKDEYGNTLLHEAAGWEVAIVKDLVSKGAKVDAKNTDGETPL